VIAGKLFELLNAIPENWAKALGKFRTTDERILQEAAGRGGPLAPYFLRAAEIIHRLRQAAR